MNTDDFIKKAVEVHGNKYDYSKVEYHSMHEKVVIVCKKHGEFLQTPANHLSGHGCRLCSTEKHSELKRSNNEMFCEKAKEKHGNKYDYSKVEYLNAATKVCIICPEHGEFWQTPNSHLSGSGCPKCGKKMASESKMMTLEEFINRSNEIHNGIYDYSKVKYLGYYNPVDIICRRHGMFRQLPSIHLMGCGCQECKREKSGKSQRLTTEEFVKKALLVHGNKYDYSKVEYVNNLTNVCIICPEHGEFWQTPNAHLSGRGCKQCGIDSASIKNKISIDDFISKANSVHNGKYDYSLVEFNNERDKVCIICPEHGKYFQTADSHLRGAGCPKCAKTSSIPEYEIKTAIEEKLGIGTVEERNRTVICPYEIDLYIPSKKIGIEYNGLVWHSEKFKAHKNYHLNKTEMAEKNGIHLIQVFEDEFLKNKDLVIEKILYTIGCSNSDRIFGRKCDVCDISVNEAKIFLNKNHIQGFSRGTSHIGCFYRNELVGVMSFLKEKNNRNEWELVRYATKMGTSCVGCADKMLKYFMKKYSPDTIKSFADRRWVFSEHNLYESIGFKKDVILKPDYRYIGSKMSGERVHKFNFRKDKLAKKYNVDRTKTESELTEELGFYKIWDCGLIRYKLKCNGTTG